MTILKSLKASGIEAEEVNNLSWSGKSKSGKKWYMAKACGANGNKFTLIIDGKTMATACIFRTAVKIIKTS